MSERGAAIRKSTSPSQIQLRSGPYSQHCCSVQRKLQHRVQVSELYPFGERTFPGAVACSPKGGQYHASPRSGEGEILASVAAPGSAKRADGAGFLCRARNQRAEFLFLATGD